MFLTDHMTIDRPFREQLSQAGLDSVSVDEFFANWHTAAGSGEPRPKISRQA